MFDDDRFFKNIESIADSLRRIANELAPNNPAASIILALPQLSRNGVPVANLELANDTVATIPIIVLDAAGQPVPAPSGDTFTATSSNPASLQATIGTDSAGNAALVLTPLVQASPGLSVTVADSSGLTSDVQGVDIVQDTTPKAVSLDLAHETTAPQPVPTNPGP